jgi:hypothetical protein
MLDAVRARGNAFRWYTISDEAAFLDRREQTRWHLEVQRDGWRLEASNPQGLSGLAWHVPALVYAGVQPVSGDVIIAPVEDGWLLRIRSGNQATVFLPALQPTRR